MVKKINFQAIACILFGAYFLAGQGYATEETKDELMSNIITEESEVAMGNSFDIQKNDNGWDLTLKNKKFFPPFTLTADLCNKGHLVFPWKFIAPNKNHVIDLGSKEKLINCLKQGGDVFVKQIREYQVEVIKDHFKEEIFRKGDNKDQTKKVIIGRDVQDIVLELHFPVEDTFKDKPVCRIVHKGKPKHAITIQFDSIEKLKQCFGKIDKKAFDTHIFKKEVNALAGSLFRASFVQEGKKEEDEKSKHGNEILLEEPYVKLIPRKDTLDENFALTREGYESGILYSPHFNSTRRYILNFESKEKLVQVLTGEAAVFKSEVEVLVLKCKISMAEAGKKLALLKQPLEKKLFNVELKIQENDPQPQEEKKEEIKEGNNADEGGKKKVDQERLLVTSLKIKKGEEYIILSQKNQQESFNVFALTQSSYGKGQLAASWDFLDGKIRPIDFEKPEKLLAALLLRDQHSFQQRLLKNALENSTDIFPEKYDHLIQFDKDKQRYRLPLGQKKEDKEQAKFYSRYIWHYLEITYKKDKGWESGIVSQKRHLLFPWKSILHKEEKPLQKKWNMEDWDFVISPHDFFLKGTFSPGARRLSLGGIIATYLAYYYGLGNVLKEKFQQIGNSYKEKTNKTESPASQMTNNKPNATTKQKTTKHKTDSKGSSSRTVPLILMILLLASSGGFFFYNYRKKQQDSVEK